MPLELLEDGQRLMGAIIGQLGRQGRNPVEVPAMVEVPAITLRVLLKIENDPNWKTRVEGALEALRACEFKLDSFGRQKEKAYGSFLGEWHYRGAGDGAHGEGTYSLFVLPGFWMWDSRTSREKYADNWEDIFGRKEKETTTMGDGMLKGGTKDGAVSDDGKHAAHGAPGSHEQSHKQVGGSRSRVTTGDPSEMLPTDGRKES